MKNPLSTGLALLLAASAFACAQVTTTSASVQTYSGNVVSVSPQASTLMISSGTSSAPMSYSYTKETRFVDSAGNAISYDAIHDDTPVQVEYITDGAVRRVNRVIVQQPAAAATTTTIQPTVPAATTTEETTTTTTTKAEDD